MNQKVSEYSKAKMQVITKIKCLKGKFYHFHSLPVTIHCKCQCSLMKYHLKATRSKHYWWKFADNGLGFKCENPTWLSFVISNACWTVPFNFTALRAAAALIPQRCDLHFFFSPPLNHPLSANRLITLLTRTGRKTTASLSWQTISPRSPERLGSRISFHVTRDPGSAD